MSIWKPMKGFSSYECNSEGVVRNSLTGKLPKTYTDRKGKNYYKLTKKYKEVSISKLMRENFPYEWIKYLEEGEEVKPLKEYSGYFITSLGRVWSMKHYKFLTPQNNTRYYWGVVLDKKFICIHTLVGRNFLPEYREGLLVLHKEETLSYPEINYVENLWVGNHKDNTRDMIEKGREGWRCK